MKVFKIDKYIAYYLGYLWADGYLKGKYSVFLDIIKTDYIEIKNVIKYLNIKNIKFRTRKNRKEQANIQIHSVKLVKILQLFDFSEKSNLQPIKILNKIPNNLHSYFYLGLFDGDGCFYIKNNTMQFAYASTYEQDYTFIENLFNLLNIRKYAIKRNVSKKNHKSSYIRITNHEDISKIINFIYPDNIYDIGLKRKYDKAQLILNNKPKYQNINLDKNKILYNIDLKASEMSNILGCSIDHCYRLKREYLLSIGFTKEDVYTVMLKNRSKLTEEQIIQTHKFILDLKKSKYIKTYLNVNRFEPSTFYKSNFNQIIIKKHFGNFYDYKKREYIF